MLNIIVQKKKRSPLVNLSLAPETRFPVPGTGFHGFLLRGDGLTNGHFGQRRRQAFRQGDLQCPLMESTGKVQICQ